MRKLVALLVILAAAGYGANQGYAWVNYQIGTPVAASSQPVPFTVQHGEGAARIADDLQSKGLVRSSEVFQLYLRFTGQRSRIQAGSYVLNKNMDMKQIAVALQHGQGQELSITIPEGFTVMKTAALVQQQGIGSAQAYTAAERDPLWRSRYPFLKSLPAGRDLEGYLFPDTYQLNRGAGPRELIKRQLDEFSRIFGPGLVQQAGQPVSGVRGPQSVDQIVILASIVQREVSKPSDARTVCGIFYNRLGLGMPLQADATVLYAEGVWKKQVLNQDLQYPSPYNTYLHPGLPPGPISNPGRTALESCVNPARSDYLYYFDDPSGKTHFATTLDRFNAEKSRYGVAGG